MVIRSLIEVNSSRPNIQQRPCLRPTELESESLLRSKSRDVLLTIAVQQGYPGRSFEKDR